MIWFAKIPWKQVLTLGLAAAKEAKEVTKPLYTPVKERKPYDNSVLSKELKDVLVVHWQNNEKAKTTNKAEWLNQDEFTKRFNRKYGTTKSRTALLRIIKQELDKEPNL